MTRIGHTFFGLFIVAFLAGCGAGTQVTTQGLDRAAGADGHIAVELQETGNYQVEAEVEHLLPPSRFGEGLTTYAVWIQGPDSTPQRLGNLDYDEGDRRGEMMATTTFSSFDLWVTGEADVNVPSPSTNVVFRTRIEAD